jgi:hypothetical protein
MTILYVPHVGFVARCKSSVVDVRCKFLNIRRGGTVAGGHLPYRIEGAVSRVFRRQLDRCYKNYW